MSDTPETPLHPQVARRASQIGVARGKATAQASYAEAAGLRTEGGRKEAYPSLGNTSKRRTVPQNEAAAPAERWGEEFSLASASTGQDYTPEILRFLEDVHGQVRKDDSGDYYYASVSTISLHFLLQSGLPGREILWQWHQFFDQERGESIYYTLPPLEDATFMELLERCEFSWDRQVVLASGLVFLPEHQRDVYLALGEFMAGRIDALWTQEEAALKRQLEGNAPTEQCIAKLMREVEASQPNREQRLALYSLLPSPYTRATARVLLERSCSAAFWEEPPEELEALQKRLVRLKRELRNAAWRMGIYCTADEFEQRRRKQEYQRKQQEQQRQSQERRSQWQSYSQQQGARSHFQRPHLRRIASEMALLGLTPEASLNAVKQAYRQKAKALHPDQGGEVHAFLRLQQAYEFLVSEVFRSN